MMMLGGLGRLCLNFNAIAPKIIRCREGRDLSFRMFIPTGIFVARDSVADFEDRKQSAHRDVIKWALTSDHRNTVARNFHMSHFDVLAVFSHSVLSHRHIAREQAARTIIELAGLNSDHIWKP